jgi:hypothetical protein
MRKSTDILRPAVLDLLAFFAGSVSRFWGLAAYKASGQISVAADWDSRFRLVLLTK